MNIETMFIRIPLQPTFFSKKSRAMLINLQKVERCHLENKTIEFYTGNKPIFGDTPFVIRYKSHEEAQQRFTLLEKSLTTGDTSQEKSQERWDMASPDPLALAALDEYKSQELK